MADIKYYDVLLKPVVTEKSLTLQSEKKYTFLVAPEANKVMIREAVEKMFDGVKVKSVSTSGIRATRARTRRARTSRRARAR